MSKSLEEVLSEYFNPSETKKAKGEPKYIIVVNGSVIQTRIKGKKELEKTLQAMAIEDARLTRSTNVLVYKLEGIASTSFEISTDINKKEEIA